MNPSNLKSSSSVPKCLKSEDPEAEIFLRNHDLIVATKNFMSQGTEFWNVLKLFYDMIELIQNLVSSLKASQNWKEATFWQSQIPRLDDQLDKFSDLFTSILEMKKMVVGLDCEGFEKVKGDVRVAECKDKTEETYLHAT